MAEAVHTAELRRLLAIIDAARTSEAADGLPIDVLAQARDLVACDVISFIEFDPVRQQGYFDQSLPSEDADRDPAPFWSHYWDSTPCCYPDRSGDLLSVTTISDFYTRREWHNTGMYTDYLGPDVEAEAMICLSAPTDRNRRLLFSRGSGPDFDGRDRLLLALLRPHLNEAYQRLARRRHTVPTLTSRQWELLQLLANGHTNTEIARELVVSVTTVRKHLENIFARLGVTNRTAAIAKAFPGLPY